MAFGLNIRVPFAFHAQCINGFGGLIFLFILFILIFLLILILLFDSFDLWVYKALHRLIGTVKRGLFFGLDFWILGVCPGFKI